jgi:hypothetical protein
LRGQDLFRNGGQIFQPEILTLHSDLVVESFSCSLISSRSEDLQIKQPVVCRDSSALDFHATPAGVPGPTLVGDEVVEVR